MVPVKITEDNLLHSVAVGSWMFLAVLSIGGLIVSATFSLSVLAGGLLAIGNFYWMQNVLRRIFDLQISAPRRYAFSRYIARIGIIALALYILMVHTHIDLIGLFTGLSVLVLDIVAVTILMASVKGGR